MQVAEKLLLRSKAHRLKQKALLPYIVCVEGNIGCGKSTLLLKLKQEGFTVIEEPVEEIWQQFLPRLYADAQRWSFTFQIEVLHWFHQLKGTAFANLLQKMKTTNDADAFSRLKHEVIIVERSPLTAINVFALNQLETKAMTKWEHSLCERFYEMIEWEAKNVMYLQTAPKICCQRIEERNRNGEHDLDSNFIQDLHKKHEMNFGNDEKISAQKVYVVDGSKDAEDVLKQALQILAKMQM